MSSWLVVASAKSIPSTIVGFDAVVIVVDVARLIQLWIDA